jgi:hypothetical protein
MLINFTVLLAKFTFENNPKNLSVPFYREIVYVFYVFCVFIFRKIKLYANNNMDKSTKFGAGVVATIILGVLLSHTRYVDFFMNSLLGRTVLLMFILGISVMNKVLGVVAVLCIIIMYNRSGLGYMEGFEGAPKSDTSSKKDSKKDSKKETIVKEEAKEGFNLIERESLMMRGKESKSIPATLEKNDNVNPADSSPYVASFSSVA